MNNGDDMMSKDNAESVAPGPLQWLTAAEAAKAVLVDTWTLEQLAALTRLGDSAITFSLGSGADGKQWVVEDAAATLVLMSLGVEQDRIWSRGVACVVVEGASATMPLPELAAALCIKLDTPEPRLPRVAAPSPLSTPQAQETALLMTMGVNWAMLLSNLAGVLWGEQGKKMDAATMASLKERGRHLIAAARELDPAVAATSWCAAFAPAESKPSPAPDLPWPGMYL